MSNPEVRTRDGRVYVQFGRGPYVIVGPDGIEGEQFTEPLGGDEYLDPTQAENIAGENYDQGREDAHDFAFDAGADATRVKIEAVLLANLPDTVVDSLLNALDEVA